MDKYGGIMSMGSGKSRHRESIMGALAVIACARE